MSSKRKEPSPSSRGHKPSPSSRGHKPSPSFSGLSNEGAVAAARAALESIEEDQIFDDPAVPRHVPKGRKMKDDDDISVLTAISVTAELYGQFLPHAVNYDVPKPSEPKEQDLLGVKDLKNLPTPRQVVAAIVKEPRLSILVQMGDKRLKSTCKSLITECSKWELCVTTYGNKETAAYLEEVEVGKIRDENYIALQNAARDYHAVNVKFNSIYNERIKLGKQKKSHERLVAIGKLLRDVVMILLDGNHVPWNGDDDTFEEGLINHVKKTLQLNCFKDCKKLFRNECLGILHIMDLFGFDRSAFFQGLFDLPPDGMSTRDFFLQYGPDNDIKTAKGADGVEQLQIRVAHYLGFSTADEPLTLEEVQQELEASRKRTAELEALMLLNKNNGAQG